MGDEDEAERDVDEDRDPVDTARTGDDESEEDWPAGPGGARVAQSSDGHTPEGRVHGEPY